jgi:phage terminase large subunit
MRDGGVPEVVDYYESHGKPLSHYLDVLQGLEGDEGTRQRRAAYRYAKHWLPHDARAKTLQTGASIIEQVVARVGSEHVALTPQLSVLDGIQAARWLMQRPELRIHSRCIDGLAAVRAYRYKWDEAKKTFSPEPVHDWASHGADAWRYLACVVRNSDLMTRKQREPPKPAARPATYSFALEDLWDTARK